MCRLCPLDPPAHRADRYTRTPDKAADLPIGAAQDRLRQLLCEDLFTFLKEKSQAQPRMKHRNTSTPTEQL
jgi:hypothetical protein